MASLSEIEDVRSYESNTLQCFAFSLMPHGHKHPLICGWGMWTFLLRHHCWCSVLYTSALRLEASLSEIEDGRASIPFDGYITPKLYRHWASSCILLRDDATVIDAFLRSRLSPPYGWGIPQCVRVRMLPPWNIHISVPKKVPTLSIMGILPYMVRGWWLFEPQRIAIAVILPSFTDIGHPLVC